MTIHLPDGLERSILEAVHTGRFSSVDDAMAEAARLLLHQIGQDAQRDPVATGPLVKAEDGLSREEVQRRLFDAGVPSEIKPPISDLEPYRNRRAVPVQGEPVSETLIRERR
jgi:Arc/MetJ-type ribon-helix-helix transcriptional regulator